MHIHIRIQSQMWMSIKIVANSSGKWHSQQARRRRENRIRSGKTRSTSRSQAKPQRSEGAEGRAGGKCIHTVSDGKWHSHSHSHSHSLQCAYVIAVIWLESLSRLRYTEKGRRKSGSRQVKWEQESGRGGWLWAVSQLSVPSNDGLLCSAQMFNNSSIFTLAVSYSHGHSIRCKR